METVKIGVVGLNFGKFLVRTLAHLPEARLVAVADRSSDIPGGVEAFAARYGARGYTDSATMFEREALDAVVIATAPKARATLIEQAAARGLPMFVEKPWASSFDHARRLREICTNHQARVMVGFSFRYHPAIVRLRNLLDGDLGPGWLLNGEYVFDFLPPDSAWLWDPENGNGLFNENSGHLFDAVCYLLGEPVSVMAETVRFSGRPSAEAAAITLKFESGAVAALTVGGYGAQAHLDFPRIDICTEHGQARLKGRHHMWEALTWATRQSDTVQTFTRPPESLGTTRYTHALTHFLDCVRNGSTPSSGIVDGERAVVLAEAVATAARIGQRIYLDPPTQVKENPKP